MTTASRPCLAACAAALCAAGSAAGAFAGAEHATSAPGAAAPMTFLDAQLEPIAGELITFSTDGVTFAPEGGAQTTAGAGEVLAALPEWWGDPEAGGTPLRTRSAPLLTLTDGQRFYGSPAESRPDDPSREAVVWQSDIFGRLVIDLERVSTVRLVPTMADALAALGAPVDDVVLLSNGDRLDGFLVGFGAEVEFESGGADIALPLDRIGAVRLVNPPVASESALTLLEDGSIARLARVEPASSEDARLRLVLPEEMGAGRSPDALVEPDDVLSLVLAPQRLVALSSLEPVRQSPIGRRRAEPVRIEPDHRTPLNAGAVTLPGPMTVDWALPAGVGRLAGWAVLPETSRLWGDCELVLLHISARGEERELLRRRLNGSSPVARVEADLGEVGPGSLLRAELHPGEYGPVRDTVVLQRVLLLRGE